MREDSDGFRVLAGSTKEELRAKRYFAQSLRNSSIPDDELLDNLAIYQSRQNLARLLFMHEIYTRQLGVHGVIMEFGVRWGQNLSLFSNFRGIHEPWNYSRRIIGFDTFEGFSEISGRDVSDGVELRKGDYAVVSDWESSLESILSFHEANSPIPHKKKFELVKGDVKETLPKFLSDHPETIISLAYFDFDLFTPTKVALELILPHLTKGSILAFDELNTPEFPGETAALREVLGLDRFRIQRSPFSPLTSFAVVE